MIHLPFFFEFNVGMVYLTPPFPFLSRNFRKKALRAILSDPFTITRVVFNPLLGNLLDGQMVVMGFCGECYEGVVTEAKPPSNR